MKWSAVLIHTGLLFLVMAVIASLTAGAGVPVLDGQRVASPFAQTAFYVGALDIIIASVIYILATSVRVRAALRSFPDRRYILSLLGGCLVMTVLVLCFWLVRGYSNAALYKTSLSFFPLHATCIAIGYSMFLAAALNSAWALADSRYSVERTAVSRRLVSYGTLLLADGILLGSMWASEAWGSFWNWDPKETCSLVTCLVYALNFHFSDSLPWQSMGPSRVNFLKRDKVFNIYSVAAFVLVIFTWFGVKWFLGGLHVY